MWAMQPMSRDILGSRFNVPPRLEYFDMVICLIQSIGCHEPKEKDKTRPPIIQRSRLEAATACTDHKIMPASAPSRQPYEAQSVKPTREIETERQQDLHRHEAVQLRIRQIPLHPFNQRVHLLSRHAPHPHQQPQTQPLQPIADIFSKPRRQPLHPLPPHPAVTRPHEPALLHIHQPRRPEHVGVPRRVAHVDADTVCAVHEQVRPPLEV